jgi:polyvinyl alcohol dehydrogenase (cytochrome)
MRSRSLLAALALVVAFLPVAAGAEDPETCQAPPHPGGEWPSYGRDLTNSRSQPLEETIGPDTVTDLEVIWEFAAADHGGGTINTTPIVHGGCLFVVPSSGEVHALDAETGAPIWMTALEAVPQGYGGGVVGAPAVADDLLVVVINRGGSPYLAGLALADGEVRWTVTIDETPSAITNASVTVYDGLAFVGFSGSPGGTPAERGGYVIVDTEEGELLVKDWTIPDEDFEAGYAGASIWSTAAVDEATGYAYVGAGNPHSDRVEHERSNALLKIDLDRERDTFGQIVASYKGQPDNYVGGLDQQPVCQDLPPIYYLSSFDASCAQLDLDFGASPNLFTDAGGGLRVGALQKSGVYHAADAETMQGVWSRVAGVPCLACNASSAAVDAERVFVSAGPPGQVWGLGQDDGGIGWVAPVLGGLSYFSVSQANGVVYTTDTYGFLNAFDADSGLQLAKISIGFGLGSPGGGSVGAGGSSGVAIARNTLYVAHFGRVLALRPGEPSSSPLPGVPDLPELPAPPDDLPAAGSVIVAQPGSAVVGYTTRVSAVPVGYPLTFINGDSALHDVVARNRYGSDGQPWCGRYRAGRCPLFYSELAGLGQTTPVLGTEHLVAGEVYEFYCTLHTGMVGQLVALPGS